MRFHHVGIACNDIAEEILNISHIHEIIDQTPVIFDPQQNAELCLIQTGDGVNLELVAGQQVASILKKRVSYYHLCFEVEDIYAEIKRIENEGGILLSPPKPALLFDNREVAFLHVSYGIIELLKSK